MSTTTTQAGTPKTEPVPQEIITGTVDILAGVGLSEAEINSTRIWLENGTAKPHADLAAMDMVDRAAAETELRQLWGNEKFDSNVALIQSYLASHASPEVGVVVKNARNAAGTALSNNSAVLQRILGEAKKPQPKKEAVGDVNTEIEKIETFMRENRAAYTRDEPLQARYRELLGKRKWIR